MNDVPKAQAAPRAPDRKLQIFRDLFRGREDVYPTRFESAKTGKHDQWRSQLAMFLGIVRQQEIFRAVFGLI